MSRSDDPLARLLRAASGAQQPESLPDGPPPGFVTRVLAECRERSRQAADYSLAILCRRAVLCSLGCAILCGLLSLSGLDSVRAWYRWSRPQARLISSALEIQLP